MAEPIPLLDLAPEIEALWDELEGATLAVLRSGRFVLGPEVEAFEREVADYLGVRHAVGLNSGTDALVIGLVALGIGPGDEVITSPFTFFATAEAISLVGATPVFVDILPDLFTIDPDRVEERITPRTRAMIPVHLFGHAASMDALSAIAERHDLRVLEDCAQAFGATDRGHRLGSLGDAAAFSFYPSKNLAAFGDAGLLATDDPEVAQAARLLRTHGSVQRDVHDRLGYNSRLDELQAAILRVKLRHVDRWNDARREVAHRYDTRLADVEDVQTPRADPEARHVYHQYTLRVGAGRRDALAAALGEEGIGTAIYYRTPVHRLEVYARGAPTLPQAEAAADEVLSLPVGPFLGSESIERVVEAVRRLLSAAPAAQAARRGTG
jgi:dTDP-4-amino-4,6-dideoxygalactose transaminase